ncbi:hypothetical protein [Bradyrhizobium sp.]|jgi:hypothetical protein|uniref:hypothetical protein n=1 Tax=Bradyrhizobium sp. TaxID=376 RepID=UPI002C9C4A28|nr:hypothetical protein [Bradyrhizobium sp.]HWX63128.1 hypothetical protein [Bradyrhizobium sp.]
MKMSSRSTIVVSLVSALSLLACAAQAQQQQQHNPQHNPPAAGAGGGPPPQARQGRPAAHVAGPGQPSMRVYGGNPYRGRMAWDRGHWRHEIHNGRDGWWWDVGGVWYFYPEQMDGPPAYISEDYADDVYPAAGGYPPPPPAYVAAPPPPPPPPDPAASAVGGAVVGGLLGGLLTGRASGAAAGAVIGGATGAIAGATAASRPGYYLADGNCYYRYPSGQYVAADPRWCY